MTFIFNDLDTIPFSNIFDYETERGVVKHYYGYSFIGRNCGYKGKILKILMVIQIFGHGV